MKRLFNFIVSLTLIAAIFLATMPSVSAVYSYDPKLALNYASKHWNDGVGECAEFVRNCVYAGGLKIGDYVRTRSCFNAILKNSSAKKHQLELNSKGKATKSLNSSILAPGDVVAQYCITCDKFPHIILFNKYASNGEALFYGHNGAQDGNDEYYATFELNKNSQHKSTCNIIAYVAHFPEANHQHKYENFFESAHPHRRYMQCACGDKYTVAQSSVSTYYGTSYPYYEYYSCEVTSCKYHNSPTGGKALPEKPVLQNMQSWYFKNKPITLSWTGTLNATNSNVQIQRDTFGLGEEWADYKVAENTSNIVNGASIKLSDTGKYRLRIENVNSYFTPTDGNQCKSYSDYVYFTIYEGPVKTYLKNIKSYYESGEKVKLEWDKTETATHYNIYFDQLVNGSYSRVKTIHYAENGTEWQPPNGKYRVLLQPTNSNYYTEDGSTWIYTNSDWVEFTVGMSGGGKCGENAYWQISENGVLTITGSGNMDNYYNQYNETMAPWAVYADKVVEVNIKGISYIGQDAFYGFTNLKKVTMEDTVTSIGYEAFAECTQLSELELSDSLTVIGQFAFMSTAIKSVDIPEGVTKILTMSFCNCENLTDVIIPSGVTEIRHTAFKSCTNLKTVTLSSSVSKIDTMAFGGCSSLTDVYYYGTEEQWSKITFGDYNTPILNANIHFLGPVVGVTGITLDKSSLTGYVNQSYTLTATVNPQNATNKNIVWKSSNESVATVKNGVVTTVGEGSATITATTEDGGFSAECTVTVLLSSYSGTIVLPDVGAGTQEGVCGENAYWRITDDGILEITGTGAMEDYTDENKAPWIRYKDNIFEIYIEGITHIGDCAFYGCDLVEFVSIDESVASIGDFAFADCSLLQDISFCDTVTELGESAFDGCSALMSVKLPSGIKEIENKTFANCSSIEEITIPKGVETVADNAFSSCASLVKINIPASVIGISENAFDGCENLVICGYEDTFAKVYAVKNDIPFKSTYSMELMYLNNDFEVIYSSAYGEKFGKMVAALYNKDGKMLDVKAFDVSDFDTIFMVGFETSLSDTDYAKVMWFDGYNTLKPICESKQAFVESKTES